MGQCVSSRSGKKGEIARKKGLPPAQYPFGGPIYKMEARSKSAGAHSRGEATSFGFKKPAVIGNNSPLEKRENDQNADLTNQQTKPVRCGTPRLSRSKKDMAANGPNKQRTNRFGFRSPVAAPPNLSNKVADSQANEIPPQAYVDNMFDKSNYSNNSDLKSTIRFSSGSCKSIASASDSSSRSSNSSIKAPSKIASAGSVSKLQAGAVAATRFTLQTSQLPRPQFPVRLATAAANYHQPVVDKDAKTAANRLKQKLTKARSENGGSSSSSVTDADSGIGSQKSGNDLDRAGIEHLDESPGAKNKFRNANSNIKKSRPMEMVFPNNQKKTFELRELNDAIEVTEIVPIKLPSLPTHRNPNMGAIKEKTEAYRRALNAGVNARFDRQTFSEMASSSDDEEICDENSSAGGEYYGDESMRREMMLSMDGGCGEELFMGGGVGEAMIGQDDFDTPNNSDENNVPAIACLEGPASNMDPPLRSVLLAIEDPTFAPLALMSSSSLIEDETSPDFSSSSPPSSTTEDVMLNSHPSHNRNDLHMSPLHKSDEIDEQKLAGDTPETPGTPTHASNSLSLSEGRDFLIDDEIADQPGLVFDEGPSSGNFGSNACAADSSGNTIVPDDHENVNYFEQGNKHNEQKMFQGRENSASKTNATHKNSSHILEDCGGSPAHNASSCVDTLSSCESIASDDFMLDYEMSDTSSAFGDHFDSRLDLLNLTDADDETLKLIPKDQLLREYSNRIANGVGVARGSRSLRSSYVGSTGSSRGGIESFTSDAQRVLRSSPLRSPHLGRNSPDDRSEDSGIRLDKETHQYMMQDVIDIKANLVTLMRILQSQESDNSNLSDGSLHNGIVYKNMRLIKTDQEENNKNDDVSEELTDLRRQVVFLQQRLKEKERILRTLQEENNSLKSSRRESKNHEEKNTVENQNAATQTDRIRPTNSSPGVTSSDNLETYHHGNASSLVSNTNEKDSSMT